jgi:Asp-tRNA(Asn)/Glu-tRNA(Gln) amidotransferase A subunit family amidase
MARTLGDCAALLAPITRLSGAPSDDGLRGKRLAPSPRLSLVDLDADVAAGFDTALGACRSLGAELVEVPAPAAELDVGGPYLSILFAELAAWHRRLADRRDLYRPALREWVEEGERQGTSAIDYWETQIQRREDTYAWLDWFLEHGVDAVIEPTVPVVAWTRGDGYDHWGTDAELISLTSYWNWTGFPVAYLPAGVGSVSGLPVGVSLIGPEARDWELLGMAGALQVELGVPEPPFPAP